VSGVVGFANGGTASTSAAAAFNAISPLTTTGDTAYEASTGTAARLPIGSSGQVYTVVSGKPAWAAAGLTVTNGYINGFTLSNDGTTPNTVLDVAAGYAADSTNAVMIPGTAFTKSIAGTWVAGTGNNGMGAGLTVAASTWYHVFAIIKSGAFDVYFDTSPTAANAPSGTTAFRYIGSFKTNTVSQIIAFTQWGQKFRWAANVVDLNGGAASAQTNVTVSAPLGFVTYPLVIFQFLSASNGGNAALYPSSAAAAISPDAIVYADVASQTNATQAQTTTNTSSQVSYAVNIGSSASVNITTTGYINPHVAANF
jgi:hypothetical protein